MQRSKAGKRGGRHCMLCSRHRAAALPPHPSTTASTSYKLYHNCGGRWGWGVGWRRCMRARCSTNLAGWARAVQRRLRTCLCPVCLRGHHITCSGSPSRLLLRPPPPSPPLARPYRREQQGRRTCCSGPAPSGGGGSVSSTCRMTAPCRQQDRSAALTDNMQPSNTSSAQWVDWVCSAQLWAGGSAPAGAPPARRPPGRPSRSGS